MQSPWLERVCFVLLMVLLALPRPAVADEGPAPGDANLDGCVNTMDLVIVDDNFLLMGGWSDGDFDGDGTVACPDVAMLYQNWGTGWCGSAGPWPGFPDCNLPRAGDANDDSYTDGGDYTVWADHYMNTGVPSYLEGGWADGNFNEDTAVDGADYTIWADAYEAPGSGLAVPEPATLSLLGVGGLALIRRWRH